MDLSRWARVWKIMYTLRSYVYAHASKDVVEGGFQSIQVLYCLFSKEQTKKKIPSFEMHMHIRRGVGNVCTRVQEGLNLHAYDSFARGKMDMFLNIQEAEERWTLIETVKTIGFARSWVYTTILFIVSTMNMLRRFCLHRLIIHRCNILL